jgi:hypothetical protein
MLMSVIASAGDVVIETGKELPHVSHAAHDMGYENVAHALEVIFILGLVGAGIWLAITIWAEQH